MQESRDHSTQSRDTSDMSSNEEEEVETQQWGANVEKNLPMVRTTEIPI